MRALFLSGSGLSAESGIPTFRGANGLYGEMNAEELLSATHYATDPASIEEWLDKLRAIVNRAAPNAAHHAVAMYQRQYPDTLVMTQNVDNLLERAGATDVVHLHGRIDQYRCVGHGHVAASRENRCLVCASRTRSDVVLFGEPAPHYDVLRQALRDATPSDALVVIGTQGVVLPIAGIARAFPGPTLLNNLHESDAIDPDWFDEVIDAPATVAAPQIMATLERWRARSGE
jgi:NAD-dependent deacetylase